jgi:hypothetical protein
MPSDKKTDEDFLVLDDSEKWQTIRGRLLDAERNVYDARLNYEDAAARLAGGDPSVTQEQVDTFKTMLDAAEARMNVYRAEYQKLPTPPSAPSEPITDPLNPPQPGVAPDRPNAPGVTPEEPIKTGDPTKPTPPKR